MPVTPLLNWAKQDAPWLVPFIVFAIHAWRQMPKPGVKWTKSVVYRWFYESSQSYLEMFQSVFGSKKK